MFSNYGKFEASHQWGFSIGYQVLANLTLTLVGIVSKLLKRIPSAQQLIYRNVIQLLVSIAFRNATNHQITIYIRDPVLRNKVYFRAFLGAVTAVGLYYGIQLISLSETVILGKTSPLWTALITIYILRQQEMNVPLMLEILSCLVGILLVVKPPFFLNWIGLSVPVQEYSQHLLGVSLQLGVAVTFSMQAIMIHNIGNAVSAFVLTEYSEVAIVVMSSIHWMLIEKVVEISLYEYLMIFIMAVLGFITQSSLTKSFGLGDVTQLQLVANCQVIFSLISDYVVLDSQIDNLSIIGTIVILVTLVINTMRQ